MRGTIKHGTQYQNDVIEELGVMYLKEKKTAKQIAEETGYSIHTVKRYLALGGFSKHTI